MLADRDRTVSGPWSVCELTVIGLWLDHKETANLSIVEVGNFCLQITVEQTYFWYFFIFYAPVSFYYTNALFSFIF